MIASHQYVMESLQEYASPKARLTRMLKSGALIQIRRGLFVDSLSVSRRALAQVIYGPSYISFQYALAFHGLILERVEMLTCASYGKNRDKSYQTPAGEFRYLYLPVPVYPYGLTLEEDDGAGYLIATAEKALCDSVYKVRGPVTSSDIPALLFEDWRIEREALNDLDVEFIAWIAPRYGKRSVAAFASWLRRECA